MTALDLVGAPRVGEGPARPSPFACPTDGSPLLWGETGVACRDCGRAWDRHGNVPLFLRGDPADDDLLARAENEGWQAALDGRASAADLDPARADWRFLLPLSERSRVLEIGAGWGSVATAIAPEVDTVVATTEDTTQARLIEIRARQTRLDNVVPAVASALYLPVPDGAFDLVVLNGVLDRSGDRGRRQKRRDAQLHALRTVRAKLAPNGFLWVGAGNRFGRRDPLDPARGPGTGRGFTCGLDGYRRLLADAGFARVDFYAPLPGLERPKELLPLADPTVTDFWVERRVPARSFRARTLKWAFRSGILQRLVPFYGIVAQ